MKTMLGRFDQSLAFVTVAELGSFTRAAEKLGCSKAHASEQVAELERALGVQLLHRTTRRLTLTEAGRLYLEYCRQLREVLLEAERAVSATTSEVGGRLRITAPTSFGEIFLPELVLAFQGAYPNVEVEIDLSVLRRDLVADGYDVALRTTRALEEHLVARPLGVVREVVVASPAFLAAHGPLDTPSALARVPCILNPHFRDDALWLFERDGRTETATVGGRLRINLYSAIRRAALAGAGVVRLPLFQVREDLESGALVRLCPGYELVAMPLYLLYPSRRHLPLRTRVFIDFLLRWFEAPERRALLT
ncbi:LysR family transcriptional regulator [Archangium lipolyticum]|uniref:LysR family transcriptional regulator n=1 Tax=Archangium lipolyticum TaxID=2970465 RepID=UPI00214A09D2|nr:LysR family transcriptional regulator [Archangium lipolyticum]